ISADWKQFTVDWGYPHLLLIFHLLLRKKLYRFHAFTCVRQRDLKTMVKLTATILCAGCFLLTVAGQDGFDLADALEPDPVTKKPAPATRRPPNNPPKLYPDLKPYGDGGNINDMDLNDGNPLPPAELVWVSSEENVSVFSFIVDSSTTAQITSPVVVVGVLLVVGAVVGYNTYKQKKFCFKPRGKDVYRKSLL
ncbi:hypothetical protein lerEdw1_016607, partial [Lerista edwardsae]